MSVGVTFLGSRTWESVCDKRGVMLKNYSEVVLLLLLFLRDLEFYNEVFKE